MTNKILGLLDFYNSLSDHEMKVCSDCITSEDLYRIYVECEEHLDRNTNLTINFDFQTAQKFVWDLIENWEGIKTSKGLSLEDIKSIKREAGPELIEEIITSDNLSQTKLTIVTNDREIELISYNILIIDDFNDSMSEGFSVTNFDNYLGLELLDIKIVDEALKKKLIRNISIINSFYIDDSTDENIVFINLKTNKGIIQLVAYGNDASSKVGHIALSETRKHLIYKGG